MKLLFLILLLLILLILLYFIYFVWWKDRIDNKRRNVETNLKMNTLKNLYYIIQHVGQISNTQPFMLYGTLLGKVRLDNILCHDFDVDYGIMDENFESFSKALHEFLENDTDYEIRKVDTFGYNFLHIIHKSTSLSADISTFKILPNSKIQRNVPNFYSKHILKECVAKYPVSWILPLRQVIFLGKPTFVPNNPDELLKCYYGNNYIEPDHVCDYKCENCKKKI